MAGYGRNASAAIAGSKNLDNLVTIRIPFTQSWQGEGNEPALETATGTRAGGIHGTDIIFSRFAEYAVGRGDRIILLLNLYPGNPDGCFPE